MLILTRKLNQSVSIGPDIKVTLTCIKSTQSVSLAIDAPRDVKILRSELKVNPAPVSHRDLETVQEIVDGIPHDDLVLICNAYRRESTEGDS